MTEHEIEYLREKHAEAAAGVRERKAGPTLTEALDLLWRPLAVGNQSICQVCAYPLESGATGQHEKAYDQVTRHGWIWDRDEALALAVIVNGTPALLSACRLAFEALDAATATLAGREPLPGSRLDDLCGELAVARDACEAALGRAAGD